MDKISFTKMVGNGNDFIVVDNRKQKLKGDAGIIASDLLPVLTMVIKKLK